MINSQDAAAIASAASRGPRSARDRAPGTAGDFAMKNLLREETPSRGADGLARIAERPRAYEVPRPVRGRSGRRGRGGPMPERERGAGMSVEEPVCRSRNSRESAALEAGGTAMTLRSIALVGLVGTVLAIGSLASAHDLWINRGGFCNAAGERCCGAGDCFTIPGEKVSMNGIGYILREDDNELVPFSEAQPSPDGAYWRCKRAGGSRRCFFAPAPRTGAASRD